MEKKFMEGGVSWFVYMIRCRNGSLYTGITTDYARRFAEHCQQNGRSAKYLRGKAPLQLVLVLRVADHSQALHLELWFKRQTKKKKELLVCGGGEWPKEVLEQVL